MRPAVDEHGHVSSLRDEVLEQLVGDLGLVDLDVVEALGSITMLVRFAGRPASSEKSAMSV